MLVGLSLLRVVVVASVGLSLMRVVVVDSSVSLRLLDSVVAIVDVSPGWKNREYTSAILDELACGFSVSRKTPPLCFREESLLLPEPLSPLPFPALEEEKECWPTLLLLSFDEDLPEDSNHSSCPLESFLEEELLSLPLAFVEPEESMFLLDEDI